MPETPDPNEVRARSAAKWVTIIGSALIALIVPAVTAYQLAASEARAAAAKVAGSTIDLAAKVKVDTQATKNEAEAGYQVLLKEVEALRAEKATRAAKPSRRHRPRSTPAPVALPTDLKKAEAAVYNTAAQSTAQQPAVSGSPDAAPRP